ncbi:hypothetical protein [Streptomyces sp. NPDC056464]|uniref:hypothetical protein n=1 Tax=Streptomyces sp. NPDC056464 TaxID=3345828 RepID=UPI0036ACB627
MAVDKDMREVNEDDYGARPSCPPHAPANETARRIRKVSTAFPIMPEPTDGQLHRYHSQPVFLSCRADEVDEWFAVGNCWRTSLR